MAAIFSQPTASFGYWRGGMSDGPLAYGQGSGRGQANSGVGAFPQGSGPTGATGSGWSPTVTYLLVFIVVELVAFKFLEKMLR